MSWGVKNFTSSLQRGVLMTQCSGKVFCNTEICGIVSLWLWAFRAPAVKIAHRTATSIVRNHTWHMLVQHYDTSITLWIFKANNGLKCRNDQVSKNPISWIPEILIVCGTHSEWHIIVMKTCQVCQKLCQIFIITNCKYNLKQSIAHSVILTNTVCPKLLTGSCFNENGFDCNGIFIVFPK